MINQGAARFVTLAGGPASPLTPWASNSTLKSASRILLRLLRRDMAYSLTTMYLEFANSSTAVTPPAVTADDTLSYYAGLSLSATRDYIRAPIVGYREESSNLSLYPVENVGHFLAQSGDTVGVNGKNFDLASNSRLIGGAVVATPVPGDPTQDILYARFYLPMGEQVTKPATGQAGLEWKLQF